MYVNKLCAVGEGEYIYMILQNDGRVFFNTRRGWGVSEGICASVTIDEISKIDHTPSIIPAAFKPQVAH